MAEIRVTSSNGEVILFAPERITLNRGAGMIRSAVNALNGSGFNRLVLDLGKTTYVDSAGLGELVSAFTLTRNFGGLLRLNRLEGKVRQLLEITKLLSVFQVTHSDLSSLPIIEIDSGDTSSIKAAEALPLLLSIREGRVRVELGVQDGVYRVFQEKAAVPDSLLLASPHVLSDGARTSFRSTLQEFEELINTPRATENDLHRFLESHPEILLGKDYRSLHSKVMLEREDDGPLIPDFLLQPLDENLCDLLELKLPNVPVVVGGHNRLRFSSAVHAAVAQLRTYSSYFDDRARREAVAARYGIRAYRPKLSVLIGRQSAIDPIEYRRLTHDHKDVQVVTYDDLLKKAKRMLVV